MSQVEKIQGATARSSVRPRTRSRIRLRCFYYSCRARSVFTRTLRAVITEDDLSSEQSNISCADVLGKNVKKNKPIIINGTTLACRLLDDDDDVWAAHVCRPRVFVHVRRRRRRNVARITKTPGRAEIVRARSLVARYVNLYKFIWTINTRAGVRRRVVAEVYAHTLHV